MHDQALYKFRRAMVILSDGDDNDSRYSREQALEMAQRSDTVIYTISTNITHIETEGDKVKHLLRGSNGRGSVLSVRGEGSESVARERGE